MKLISEISKREYQAPKLTCTVLDITISLEMQSEEPPAGPGEPGGPLQSFNAPQYFNNNNPLNA